MSQEEDSCRTDAKVPVVKTAVSSFFCTRLFRASLYVRFSRVIRAVTSSFVSTMSSHAQRVTISKTGSARPEEVMAVVERRMDSSGGLA